MNLLVGSPPRPDGDLDGLLHDYFQAEMPRPWPALMVAPAVRQVPRPSPARPSILRSRLALAASVALLVTSSLVLPGKFSSRSEDSPPLTRPEATRPILPAPDKGRIKSETLWQTKDGTQIEIVVE